MPHDPDSACLEKLITDSIIKDAKEWRQQMARLEAKVCRVEIPTAHGTVFGTGFLVGPDCVLTNFHVVENCADCFPCPAWNASGHGSGRKSGSTCGTFHRWMNVERNGTNSTRRLPIGTRKMNHKRDAGCPPTVEICRTGDGMGDGEEARSPWVIGLLSSLSLLSLF